MSVFLKLPHMAIRHERVLLNQFQNKIFLDNQSLYPYFTAPYTQLFFDESFREEQIPRSYKSFKNHLMLIFCVLANSSFPPSIEKETQIDQYCKKIIDCILDKETIATLLNRTCFAFDKIVDAWVQEKGETYRSGIKDSEPFTNFLLKKLATAIDVTVEQTNDRKGDASTTYRGTIVRLNLDRYNHFYGYILRKPNNVFFHEKQNPSLTYEMLNKDVLYEIEYDKFGKEIAKIIKIV